MITRSALTLTPGPTVVSKTKPNVKVRILQKSKLGERVALAVEGKPLPKDGSPRLYICLTCNEERQYDLWDLRDDEGHFTLGLPETHVKNAP
jgi:hypothetical protein